MWSQNLEYNPEKLSKRICSALSQKTTHNNEEVAPGIRRYVFEHIQNLDKVLADLERAGVTIAGAKSQFCQAGLKIVGFICDADGRHPDTSKVLKILDWPECTDVTSARAFMGVCVYYRIWIRDFAQVAAPIYLLFKKNAPFIREKEQAYFSSTVSRD